MELPAANNPTLPARSSQAVTGKHPSGVTVGTLGSRYYGRTSERCRLGLEATPFVPVRRVKGVHATRRAGRVNYFGGQLARTGSRRARGVERGPRRRPLRLQPCGYLLRIMQRAQHVPASDGGQLAG